MLMEEWDPLMLVIIVVKESKTTCIVRGGRATHVLLAAPLSFLSMWRCEVRGDYCSADVAHQQLS